MPGDFGSVHHCKINAFSVPFLRYSKEPVENLCVPFMLYKKEYAMRHQLNRLICQLRRHGSV